MKDHNYITIQGWMVNRLKLSGNELLAYAAIWGFSQDGESFFRGSGQYLADALGISRRSIVTILDKLAEKGLVKKHAVVKNGARVFGYRASKWCEETSQGGAKKLHSASEETSHNITRDIPMDKESGNSEELPDPLPDSAKESLELSSLLLRSHRKEFPDYLSGKKDKETVERWAGDIERLIRIDKKPPDAIRKVILWVKTPGNFWFHNIESGKKLREKFERLYGEHSQRHSADDDCSRYGKPLVPPSYVDGEKPLDLKEALGRLSEPT